MNMPQVSRNGRIGLGILTVLVVGGLALWLGGYGPQIGRFFAAEPGGYIPFCAGYGQQVTLYPDGGAYPSCCSGLLPTFADAGRFEAGGPAAEVSDDAAVQGGSNGNKNAYCVMPECKVYRKSVQCIQAPCEPVIEIVCPPGVTTPPPPTFSPTPTYSPGPGVSLGVRSEHGASIDDIGWVIPISPGEETAVQIFVSSNPGELGLTAAHLHLRTSPGLRMTGFALTDFHETLEPATFNPSPDNATDMTVTVGSGTQPVTGEPVVGTLTIAAAGDASGVLVLDFMGDSEMTAIGRNGNVFFGTTGARFPVVSPSPSIDPQQPGDADGDGDVDIFDYNLVVSNFGRTTASGAIRLEGDLDRDADVDIFDYNLVVSNFGHGVQ